MIKGSFAAEAIDINVILLKFCGVLPSDTLNFSCLRRVNVFAMLSYFCITIYSISYIQNFVTRAVYDGTALEIFSMSMFLVVGQSDYTILLYSRRKFRAMLKLCEELWRQLDDREKECILLYTRVIRKLTYYYFLNCVVTALFYVLSNLLMATNAKNLPYPFVVNFDRSPYFEIAYVYQIVSVISASVTCIASDTAGPVLILVASGHLKVIELRILRLMEQAEPLRLAFLQSPLANGDRDSHEISTKELRSCIDYHVTLLHFCEDIGKLTNVIFLLQLIGSTYNISLVGFKMIGNDADKYKYSTQVLIALLQLFLCNWPSSVLITESENIGKATYSVPWYFYSKAQRKSVHFMIMRSQKPVQLTAGKFVHLSLETFASMVSTAASFFTVINGMNSS